jgi:predicted PurR-regulated permease PerM
MPVTVKRSLELLGLFLIGTIVIVGKMVIMPLMMSFFFSLVLLPVFRLFRKLKIPEVIAIFLSILMLIVLGALVIWLFYGQVSSLLGDLPQIQVTVANHLDIFSQWIGRNFGFSPESQVQFIREQSNKLFSSAGSLLSGLVGSVSGLLLFFGLMPVYIFLILLYRNLFLNFLLMCFDRKEKEKIEVITRQTERMVKSYLVGLLIQVTYLTVLLGGILLLFGFKHAMLIGIIFAFSNLIPYLGSLVAEIIAVLLTLASSEHIIDILILLGVIAFVQFLDNNILMPRIVGYKVKINALVSIVSIIVGGAMVGISGMFLAMPVVAMLKIVFDHTVLYKNWGYLLGDERPAKSPFLLFGLRRRVKI